LRKSRASDAESVHRAIRILAKQGLILGPCRGIITGYFRSASQRVVNPRIKIMSRVCQVTGKRPMSGNNVSHAKNRTRRRFLPNLHVHRFWVASENRYVKLRVSAQGIRIIDKKGIDSVLQDVRARGEQC